MTDFGTLRGTPTYATDHFGQVLTAGVVGLAGAPFTSTVGTVECWVKTTYSGSTLVAVGNNGTSNNGTWLGVNGGQANAAYSGAGGGPFTSGGVINDGNWHHLALTWDGTNVKFWVDGALKGTTAFTGSMTMGPGTTGIGGFGAATSFDWNGSIDEVRFSNSVRYTTTFTPSASAFTTDGNTTGLYHLNGDATDSSVAATVPGAPTSLGATPGNGQVALSWTAPASNGGAAITDYTVQYRTTAGPGAWTTFSHTASTATTATVTGLTNGTSYDFQVAAVNSVGTGSYSSTATATPASGTTVPGQPTGLGATAGNTQASLSWTAPASNGGAAITDYLIEYSANSGSSWSSFSHTASTATTASVTSLANGTTYLFRVSAINSVGTGTASSTASATPTTSSTSPAPNDAGIVYSPGVWDVTSVRAATINPGAYLRTIVVGAPGTLAATFDTTSQVAPLPYIEYRVDNGPWTTAQIASSVTLTVPSNGWGKHTVEIVVQSTTEFGASRWSPQTSQVKFTGFTTTTAVTLAAPASRPLKGLVLGDSITEGYKALSNITSPDGSSSRMAWAYQLRDQIGAEIGVVGFGGQAWLAGGVEGVPALPSSYTLLWGSGPTRTLTGYDFVLVNMGENDNTADIVSTATTFLTNLLAAVSPATMIGVLVPFSQREAANLTSAVTAVGSSRVKLIATSGLLNSADTADGQHPYGYTSMATLAPGVAAALRTAGVVSGATKRWINVGGVAKPVGTVIKS